MRKNELKITINADGGSRGNPGPSALGVVIRGGGKDKKYSEFLGTRTNNEAEYEAVIFAMKKAKQIFGKEKIKNSEVEIYLDSELVYNQLNARYKIEEERLFPLFIKIWNLKQDFEEISFFAVPREKNREADRLVNIELDKKEQGKIF
ncbi:MAG: ribonuclease HI family protein [Candidatus Niyogibacteria bacterium]|nr:MAG: ribonuclease HI family protein [Candidatus Niyogibacteria bacterium]